MTTLQFIIGSLATFRVATMVSQEKGPGFIFCRLRNAQKKGSALKEGLSCPLCMSVWSGLGMAFTYYCMDVLTPGEIFPTLLAFSAVSVILSLTVAKDL